MKTKYDDIIILYLDNRMTAEERSNFEDELKSSAELYKRFNHIKANLEVMSAGPTSGTEEDYFNNLLPLFRQKLEQNGNKNKLRSGYKVLAVGLGTVVLLLLILLFNNDYNNQGTLEMAELNYSEDEEILSSYMLPDDLSSLSFADDSYLSEKIDSIFAEQYVFAEAAGSYLDYNFVINSISDEEADHIYTQLINKDILSGEL